jgi:hypothetical protein
VRHLHVVGLRTNQKDDTRLCNLLPTDAHLGTTYA